MARTLKPEELIKTSKSCVSCYRFEMTLKEMIEEAKQLAREDQEREEEVESSEKFSVGVSDSHHRSRSESVVSVIEINRTSPADPHVQKTVFDNRASAAMSHQNVGKKHLVGYV